MSKSRKRIFPKPPQRLNSKTAETLGKNSNLSPEVNVAAIYNTEPKQDDSKDRYLSKLKSMYFR